MIPITVSFFLNQRGGILQAIVFSLGIVVLFCSLGLGVTAAIGPFGIAQLGSNPWVNAFIALVFGIFALSLMGAFEITLPSRLLTKLDSASRRGGYLGTLLMGLTFSLTSFACVGPFVGSLLVSSVQAKGAQPVVGMLSFAAGLASPFFFLAAFPSYLKKLPKSGGWLARVKVVMGFVLLALMLKYVSNIDQVLQTGFLTRERFLAAWFVLFSLPGLYLLGLLRLEGVEPGERLGIGRLLVASAFLIFALMLLPGMFGAPLGELDAYVPQPSAQTAFAGGAAQARPAWMKNQYREALDRARQENKLVLVNFTGYSCTNCKWMDANMFPRPEIAEAVKNLIPVELYVDGADAASEQNQKLEDDKFKTASMPYYALVDADERIVSQFGGATRDPGKFLSFLKTRPGAL
jgi:thiol:disulfide interchange protein DsbD